MRSWLKKEKVLRRSREPVRATGSGERVTTHFQLPSAVGTRDIVVGRGSSGTSCFGLSNATASAGSRPALAQLIRRKRPLPPTAAVTAHAHRATEMFHLPRAPARTGAAHFRSRRASTRRHGCQPRTSRRSRPARERGKEGNSPPRPRPPERSSTRAGSGQGDVGSTPEKTREAGGGRRGGQRHAALHRALPFQEWCSAISLLYVCPASPRCRERRLKVRWAELESRLTTAGKDAADSRLLRPCGRGGGVNGSGVPDRQGEGREGTL